MNSREITRETINEKRVIVDGRGQKYLILKLDNDKGVLVFHNKVEESRWDLLLVRKIYDLVIEKNERDNWILVDFYFVV